MRLRPLAEFAGDLLRVAGWRAPVSAALIILLGMLDGVGLLLLVPMLGAAGVATGETVLPGPLQPYLPSGSSLETIVVAYLAVVLGYVSLKFAGTWLNATLTERYSAATRIRVHAQLTRMSWRAIVRHTGGDVAHALTTNVDTLTRGAMGLLQLATGAVLLAVQLAVAAHLSMGLALGAAALLAGAVLAGGRFNRQLLTDARSTVTSGRRLHHGAEDFIRRHRHVRAFGNEARTQADFADEARAHSRSLRDIQRAMGKTHFLTETTAVVLIAVTLYAGLGPLQMPLASLAVFTVILARLLPRAMALQREAQIVAAALPARQTIERLAGTPDTPAATVRAAPAPGPVASVAWEGVSYRIDKLRWRIDRLELRKGRLAALVGASGIGKSVLCDVLAGLLAPEEGRCSIDGAPLPPGASLADAIRLGYLAQHSRPWQATVAEALRWAEPAATDADCWTALRQAGLAQTLEAREGLDTALGDAALWLSGGELHRLALAQVLMRKPQVLLLDEPSAAVDAGTELRLIETIKALAADRPVLVVTHRESVAEAADDVWALREDLDGARAIECEAQSR